MEKLVLIDGNSLLNRAYFATPVFTTKEGFPTNAIFGFLKLLMKIASDKKPQYLAVAFDLPAPTFRHKLYQDYKAGRKPMPDDLKKQLPVLKEVLSSMNIAICELAGYEADDVVGTLSKRFSVQTYIYTGDRDAYQLVDATTNVCFTKRGVSDILELSNENFKDEVGLIPSQIIDLKSLMGDSSDHIPGVNGIGEKTAHTLLEKYSTLEGVYAHLDEIKGAVHNKLSENKESAFFSYKLATIDTDTPINLQLSDLVFYDRYSETVRKKFIELEFKTFLSMPIFDKEQIELLEKSEKQADEFPVELIEMTTIDDKILLQDKIEPYLSCVLTDKEFRLCTFFKSFAKEYIFPIKINLFDVGFYLEELTPILKAIFEGTKKIVVYDSKDIRKRLREAKTSFTAQFEDVSLIRYISEGSTNSEKLEYLLDYYSLAEDRKAYGVYRLYKKYDLELGEDEKKLYREIELPLSKVLFDMEENGVCADEKMISALSEKYNAELKELSKNIYALAGEEFNINSPIQLGRILFDKLKIGNGAAHKTKSKKNYDTSAEVLEKFAEDSELVRVLLRYRQAQKINSTYLEGFKPLIREGKVHTTYNQSNTSTGRLSSANPNLQNIPIRTEEGRELRKIFRAGKGNVLIDADYSQIELRLLAHFSGCEELKKAYNEGKDIHAITASQVFGVPLNKVTSQMRRNAKAVNFGIIYGISAFGLGKDLSVSSKKAKEYIDKYFDSYSDVKKYMESNVENAKRDGYVKTLFGRKRIINELKSSNFSVRSFGERAAMNMPLQGTSADIIKIAMIKVSEELSKRNLKAQLVLQVHDELVIDCPKEEQEEVANLLKDKMEHAVELSVPLTVEVGIGENWFDAH